MSFLLDETSSQKEVSHFLINWFLIYETLLQRIRAVKNLLGPSGCLIYLSVLKSETHDGSRMAV